MFHKNITYILLTVFLLTACSEDFLDQDTQGIIAPDNLFVDEAGFNAGLNGLYATVRIERAGLPNDNNPTGTTNNLVAEMMMNGTDIMYGNRPAAFDFLNDWGDISLGASASNGFETLFDWLYEAINAANTIINRGENFAGDNIEPAALNRILAEARTIRAWCYRHLTFLFGDVPLVLEESTGETVRLDFERNSVAEIRAQMRADLEFAVQNLPTEFRSDGTMIRAVAQHYLTELLIIQGEYTTAIATALDAINNSGRSLVTSRYGVNASEPGTPYTDMFLEGNTNPSEGNTEVLWVFPSEFGPVGGEGNNIMRRWFTSNYDSTSDNAPGLTVTVDRGGRGLNRVSATNFMLNLYDPTATSAMDLMNVADDRGGMFAWRHFFTLIEIDPPAAGNVGDTLYLRFDPSQPDPRNDRFRVFTRKWDSDTNVNTEDDPQSDASTRSYKDFIYLRLADTYLLLAEAYFLNGNPDRAAQTINVLRNRANAAPITPGDVTLDFILDERARELFSEEHRRYTLLRTGTWVNRTQLHNDNASPNINEFRDVLYPIPQSFIDANIDNPIQNNPGY